MDRYRLRQISTPLLFTLLFLGVGPIKAQWTAFNDCLREPGDATAPQVTGWTIHDNDRGHGTGVLQDFQTGSEQGMPTVRFTMGAAGLNVSSGGAGGNPSAGSDAHALFNGIIDFGPNNVYYGDPGWWVEIEFTGLDPAGTYLFAGTAIRSKDYPDRVSFFTLLDALDAANTSSDGILAKSPESTLLLAGDNRSTGYLVRWDEIRPSPAGTFRVRSEATAQSSGGRAYPLAGFMLKQLGPVGPKPPEVDAGDYDALTWPLHSLHLSPIVHPRDTDEGADFLDYHWSQVSGPGSVSFDPTQDLPDPRVIFPGPGDYGLELTVTDGRGLSSIARVTVTVLEALLGDLDGNARVNWRDLQIFSAQWLDRGDSLANLDALDSINLVDLALLAENWGNGIAGTLFINEFLARNELADPDPQGEHDDWIEIFNAGSEPINLAGLFLTDDPSDPTQWAFPPDRPAETTIGPLSYLLIWADGDQTDAGLHASFSLDADQGGVLALVDVDGITPVDTVTFDKQTPDVSYGREPDAKGPWVTLSPTPGRSNRGATLPVVAEVSFSHSRGFYESPFDVTLSTDTAGAIIRYTLDGSSPTEGLGIPYQGPITIKGTTCLRALAHRPGWKATPLVTHTYIFLDQVIHQATNPATGGQVVPFGYPTSWGSVGGDYQMDPDVVGQAGQDRFGGQYAATIKQDLQAVPTVSLVMDPADWFGPRGIYIHKSQDGTERVCSLEFIDPLTGSELQVNTALAMQGGVSGGGTSLNRWKSFKLSMRPRFKPQTDDGTPTGGPGKVDFPFLADSPVTRYNSIVLDAVLNHAWLHPSSGQRNTAMYIQDQYVADLHKALGGDSPHGRYVHLYLNGLYWGMYYLHERPDHTWAAEVFGGPEDEYDALKHNRSNVINNGLGGSATGNFNAMISAADAVAARPADLAAYQRLQAHLDVDNLITYLLANWFTGNHDWPHKNWYTTHHSPNGLWRFHSWDAEHSLEGGNDVGESPMGLPGKLEGSREYRMRFTDIVYRAFFREGPLSPAVAAQLYQERVDQVTQALVGESARWGDNRRSLPHTRDDWLRTQTGKLDNFFPGRSNQVLTQFRNAGLYPQMEPPLFRVQGAGSYGGHLSDAEPVTLSGTSGLIIFTTDGTDPRGPGGAIAPGATNYQRPLSLAQSTHLKARLLAGGQWSALAEAIFAVGPVAEQLRITELMYHPLDSGQPNDPNAEYIELRNIGSSSINLNLVRFTDGVEFTFGPTELEPQQQVLIVRDIDAFEARYGGGHPVAGTYQGRLSNGGERIRLEDALGGEIMDFRFEDKWFDVTDGGGYSLEVRDPLNADPTDWSGTGIWRASPRLGGSPGE